MKIQTSIRRTAVASALAAAGLMAAPTPAHACGGGWWPEPDVDYRIQGVARAERQLDEGDYAAAAGAVVRMIPHIKNYEGTSRDPIVNRALRVLAVATARADGRLEVARELPRALHDTWLGEDEEAQQTNLNWAVATLQHATETDRDDVMLQSELALAMSRTDDRRVEGRRKLEALAARDLLTSPEAYAELAAQRHDEGDATGHTAALERCRAMADEAAVCRAHG
ncbi:MAG: hypothetical protein AAF928_15155 [Myxococcota bacterium]